MSKRTIFIGDVHGCYEELLLLIEKIKPSSRDMVILLGDLIGKGPMEYAVLKYVYDKKFRCLMGNHEWNYLRRVQYSFKKRFPSPYHEWIASLPQLIEGDTYLAVHAGLPPVEKPYESTTSYMNYRAIPLRILVTIRYWRDGDVHASLGIPWHRLYTGKKTVVYGHWAKQGLFTTPNTVGIDTGCVYGKCLTAYLLESKTLIQVKAKHMYADIKNF